MKKEYPRFLPEPELILFLLKVMVISLSVKLIDIGTDLIPPKYTVLYYHFALFSKVMLYCILFYITAREVYTVGKDIVSLFKQMRK